MIFQFLILSSIFLTATYLRLHRTVSEAYLGGVPRVGKSGVLGYIKTAIKWTIDAPSVILEGRAQFLGRPFVIPTLSGPVFFLPPKYTERLRSSNDDFFSQIIATNDDLQLPYTMDPYQLDNPYQAKVMKGEVTRALPAYIPELLDESVLAMDETFIIPPGQKSISVPIFDALTHLVGRISNRVIFGTELCRNKRFVHDVVRFAETTPMIAPFISWSPYVLRPVVYFVLSKLAGGKEEPLRFIVPFIERYLKERETMADRPNLVMEHLIQEAPSGETIRGLGIRLLNLNFGSIHTSSIFTTQVLLEIALLSPEDVESMRVEVRNALESEGGWTKGMLLKLRKIDSALREVGRVYGLMHFALGRVAVVGCDLEDGMRVPPGGKAVIDMTAVHFNPEVYSDPSRCNLFRFAEMRDKEDSDTKYGFATVDSNYLPFGAGRHACAGRFFAATELKIMIAHLLLRYDITLPPGTKGRPKNIFFNGAVVPDPKAHLIFTPRNEKVLH